MKARLAALGVLVTFAVLAVVLSSGSAAASHPAVAARALGGSGKGNAPQKFAPPTACSPCLYYSGDFDPNDANANGLANEDDAIVNDAHVYTPVTPDGTWHATGLFINTLSGLTPTSATWEIRTGVSEGNGGSVVASGSGAVTQTATGRSDFGFTEYTDSVSVSVTLNAGTTYWINVTPVCVACSNRAFESDVPPGTAANHVGPANIVDDSFFNSTFFGANFTSTENEGTFQLFSFGVVGTSNPTITVTKHLISNSNDPAKFNLRIDGTTYAANVGDGGTTGAVTVTPGTHTVSETAGLNANMNNYQARIACSDGSAAYATSLQVTVSQGEQLTCTITNTRKLFKV